MIYGPNIQLPVEHFDAVPLDRGTAPAFDFVAKPTAFHRVAMVEATHPAAATKLAGAIKLPVDVGDPIYLNRDEVDRLREDGFWVRFA